MTWQEDHIANAERMIDYARSTQPGNVGSVPLRLTTEIEACGSFDYPDVPLEALGDRPPRMPTDRHRLYEETFNALADERVAAGKITADEAAAVKADFHVWISGTRFQAPQTSPKFYQ